MKKIAPSDRLRKELKEFIEGLQDVESAQEALTQLVQLSTRLICQEGFEALRPISAQHRTAILTTRPQARLVSDELYRCSTRLLERRRKQAKFRDPQKTLYNFDFSFNQKMNRSLVFDLVLLGGVWIHLPPTSGTPSRLEPEPCGVQPTGVNSQPAAWAERPERPSAAAEDNPC